MKEKMEIMVYGRKDEISLNPHPSLEQLNIEVIRLYQVLEKLNLIYQSCQEKPYNECLSLFFCKKLYKGAEHIIYYNNNNCTTLAIEKNVMNSPLHEQFIQEYSALEMLLGESAQFVDQIS